VVVQLNNDWYVELHVWSDVSDSLTAAGDFCWVGFHTWNQTFAPAGKVAFTGRGKESIII